MTAEELRDRALLEQAAKAAGLQTGHPWNRERLLADPPVIGLVVHGSGDAMFSANWNPLEFDGDAFRLMVALDIEVYQGDDDGPAVFAGYWGKRARRDVTRLFCIEPLEPDRDAATRRAIVRAAAEMGSDSNDR